MMGSLFLGYVMDDFSSFRQGDCDWPVGLDFGDGYGVVGCESVQHTGFDVIVLIGDNYAFLEVLQVGGEGSWAGLSSQVLEFRGEGLFRHVMDTLGSLTSDIQD